MEKGSSGKDIQVINSMVCLQLRHARYSRKLGQDIVEEVSKA